METEEVAATYLVKTTPTFTHRHIVYFVKVFPDQKRK